MRLALRILKHRVAGGGFPPHSKGRAPFNLQWASDPCEARHDGHTGGQGGEGGAQQAEAHAGRHSQDGCPHEREDRAAHPSEDAWTQDCMRHEFDQDDGGGDAPSDRATRPA